MEICGIPASYCQIKKIMRKLLFIITALISLAGSRAIAGQRHITGKVTDERDMPLPGATIVIDGTSTGTYTNSAGKYSITVPDGYSKLSFTFVGYNKQTITIGTKDTINIKMEPNTNSLNEVVVVGYGVQRRTTVTGSVSTVTSSQVGSSGSPGAMPQIVIRGVSSSPMPASSHGYATAQVDSKQLNQSAVTNISTGLQGKVYGLQVQIKDKNTLAQQNPVQIITPTDPGDESYKKIVDNPFNLAKDNPLSTFSVDVDGASYSNVRRYINNGQLPPADAVRIEEMLNYFTYDMKGPEGNSPVAIHTELSSAPWNSKHRLLRIALKARAIPDDKLPPSNLAFLIDVSGSMDMPNKLPLVKAAMKMLVDGLRPEDKVSIVTYAGQAGIDLQPTHGDRKATIDSAIDVLNAMGSTNGGEGIKMAYKLAREQFIKNGNNRIVMCTDGDFNVGPSSDEDMETLVSKERASNVDLSVMGFGMGNVKDSKMETIADKGNGNYFYIDNVDEARRALVTEFAGTMFTVAKDVKLQVEFNPARVQAYRLIGYEDRLMNKEDFNNDRKDAGDMGSGHAVTALYEIVPAGIKDDQVGWVDSLKYQKNTPNTAYNSSDELLTIKFRYKQPQSLQSELSQAEVKDNPVELSKTSADFKFDAAIAEFGMLLRDSPYKQKSTYDDAINLAKKGKADDKDGYRSEFARLVESAKMLTRGALAAQ
jgi:Ca-activated chloride channel family protein